MRIYTGDQSPERTDEFSLEVSIASRGVAYATHLVKQNGTSASHDPRLSTEQIYTNKCDPIALVHHSQ